MAFGVRLTTLDLVLDSDETFVFFDEGCNVVACFGGRTGVGTKQLCIGVLHGRTLVRLGSITCEHHSRESLSIRRHTRSGSRCCLSCRAE